MDGPADRVDEALVRVGSEVNGDRGTRGDAPCHLDVQHHLTVRPVGGARRFSPPSTGTATTVGSGSRARRK